MTRWKGQHAVVWEFSSYGADGEPTVKSPEVIEVRWENVVRSLTLADGTTVDIRATLFVEELIPIHSIVYKNVEDDIPSDPDDLYIVVDYEETPDLKGRSTDKVVYLSRYTDSLPTVV